MIEAGASSTDVGAGTHSLRGVADTTRDVLAGLAGTGAYLLPPPRPRQPAAPH